MQPLRPRLRAARRCWQIVVIIAVSWAGPALAASDDFSPVAGWWQAEARYRDEATPVYLHFSTTEGGAQAHIGLPVIGFWDVPVGPVELSAEAVRLPGIGWELSFDAARDRIDGTLPESLVPVYSIAVSFRRVAAPAPPAEVHWQHPRPEMRWRYRSGAAVWAGVALDPQHEMLYVANDAGIVVALRAASGQPLWTAKTGAAIRARPTVAGAFLYVSSDDGHVYKFARDSGEPIWQTLVDAEALDTPRVRQPFDRTASSAQLSGDRLYVGSLDGSLHALAADTGRELWRVSSADRVTGTPAVHGDAVVFGSYDGHLYAVAAADGSPRWRFAAGGAIPSDVAVVGDRMLVGTRAYDLFCLDARSGQPVWRRYLWFSWVESVPSVRDGTAYVGSSDAATLFAVDVEAGTLRWGRALPGWSWAQPAVGTDSVYTGTVGASDAPGQRSGSFVAVERHSGGIRWLYPATPRQDGQWGFAASPALGDDVVFAADLAGDVIAFAAAKSAEHSMADRATPAQ